jgi:hypothetical protein
MVITGACLCGNVSFEASEPPRRVTHCHCGMCRRAVGAAVATFATFDSDKAPWSPAAHSRGISADFGHP